MASAVLSFLRRGRWLTPEFLLYYAILAFSYSYAIREGWELSTSLAPGGENYGVLGDALRPGWLLPGPKGGARPVDLSDHQWRNFRANLPTLGAALLAYALLARGVRRMLAPPPALVTQLLLALAFVTYLHGAKVLFLLALALANFALARGVAGRQWAAPLVLWGFNCAAWLAVQYTRGGSFEALAPPLAWLDDWEGPVRWHVGFNLVILRMLSYGLDAHWAASGRPAPSPSKLAAKGDQFTRAELSRLSEEYGSVGLYLLYLLYPPLYLTGPTTTFNAFASYLQRPQAGLRAAGVAAYAARWVAALLLTEVTGGLGADYDDW